MSGAADVNSIINKLLMPDNNAIKEGTEELKKFVEQENAIPGLLQVMVESNSEEVKKYAAIILKKRFRSHKHWRKLSANTLSSVKEVVLKSLIQDSNIKNSTVAQLAASIFDKDSNGWPQLLQFFTHCLTTENMAEKEHGMLILSYITECTTKNFNEFFTQFCGVFANILKDPSTPLAYYTAITLTNLIPRLKEAHEVEKFQEFVPLCLKVTSCYLKTDEDKACKTLDMFDCFIAYDISLQSNVTNEVLNYWLEVVRDKSVFNSIRCKCLSLLSMTIRMKRKFISKCNLVPTIIEVLYGVLCEPSGDDDMALGFLGTEDSDSSPIHGAAQAMDAVALHFSPDKVLPPVDSIVEKAQQSADILQIKGSYLTLAMIAEGCSDTLRKKHLHSLLKGIAPGITSNNEVLRNSALFALGQFAEHLQPDISQYHSELLPVLFEFLKKICENAQNGGKDPAGIDKMFYALEVFCEHLNNEIEPYIPPLMDCLFLLITNNTSIHMKELAISAIGAISSPANKQIVPYFEEVVDHLKKYLVEEQPPDMLTLQVQSIDTLSQMARCMGAEHFTKYAVDCCNLGMNILMNKDDPDVRKSCYLLFAAVSSVASDVVSSNLSKVVECMIKSLNDTEGVSMTNGKDEDLLLNRETILEGFSDSEDEDIEVDLDQLSMKSDEDNAGFLGYSVRNSYMSEKEDTCIAFKEIASNCKEAFSPYLDKCADAVYNHLINPVEDIRQAAVSAISQFTVSFASISEGNSEGLIKWAVVVIPKLVTMARSDTEYSVVMSCLEGLTDIIKYGGKPVLDCDGHLDATVNCITSIINCTTQCQDMADEEGSDDSEAEQDELLIEYAGEIIPIMGKALGPEAFAQHFPHFLQLFEQKLKGCSSPASRSFCVGTLSECVAPLGPATDKCAPKLLSIFTTYMKDEEGEVRSNALYGLGLLGEHGGEYVHGQYPRILQSLSMALDKESFFRAIDNICGAIARFIMAKVELVPMEQVFSCLLRCLPLREDFEENITIFKCFLYLWENGHPVFVNRIKDVLRLSCAVITSNETDEETVTILKKLLWSVKVKDLGLFEAVLSMSDQQTAEAIRTMISA